MALWTAHHLGTLAVFGEHPAGFHESDARVNRGQAPDVGASELVSLLDYRLDSWPADECPLCRDGVPVNTEYAHGREFVQARRLRERR